MGEPREIGGRDGQASGDRVIGGDDPAAEIAKLKEELGRAILVHASARLVELVLDARLVDELRLLVFPVVPGRGRRLFLDQTAETPLELVELKTVGDQRVILQVYRPKATPA